MVVGLGEHRLYDNKVCERHADRYQQRAFAVQWFGRNSALSRQIKGEKHQSVIDDETDDAENPGEDGEAESESTNVAYRAVKKNQ